MTSSILTLAALAALALAFAGIYVFLAHWHRASTRQIDHAMRLAAYERAQDRNAAAGIPPRGAAFAPRYYADTFNRPVR